MDRSVTSIAESSQCIIWYFPSSVLILDHPINLSIISDECGFGARVTGNPGGLTACNPACLNDMFKRISRPVTSRFHALVSPSNSKLSFGPRLPHTFSPLFNARRCLLPALPNAATQRGSLTRSRSRPADGLAARARARQTRRRRWTAPRGRGWLRRTATWASPASGRR